MSVRDMTPDEVAKRIFDKLRDAAARDGGLPPQETPETSSELGLVIEDNITGESICIPMRHVVEMFPEHREERARDAASLSKDSSIPIMIAHLHADDPEGLWSTLDAGNLTAAEKIVKRATLRCFSESPCSNPGGVGLLSPADKDNPDAAPAVVRDSKEKLRTQTVAEWVLRQKALSRFLHEIAYPKDKERLTRMVELYSHVDDSQPHQCAQCALPGGSKAIREEMENLMEEVAMDALLAAQLQSEVRDINALLKAKGIPSPYDDNCREVFTPAQSAQLAQAAECIRAAAQLKKEQSVKKK